MGLDQSTFFRRLERVGDALTPDFVDKYSRQLSLVENIRLFMWLGLASWDEFESLPLDVYAAALQLRRQEFANGKKK